MFAGASAQSYTQAFDSVFQHVDLSHTSTGILYERVLPLSNLVSYVTDIPHPADTCDFYQFVMAYDELYCAGAQNTFLTDSVERMLGYIPTDNSTVVLGMLHANFNTFDTSALRQRLYYDADSVLWENTTINVPLFNEHNAFMVAPLVEQTSSLEIQFIIDHRFFFYNTTNPIISLTIDFGDGIGNRVVAMNSSVNVLYPSDGDKIIRVSSTFSDGSTVITYAKLRITRNLRNSNGTSAYPYTEDLSVLGITPPPYPYNDGGNFETAQGSMRIYYANADRILRKPVLIADGFDPENNRRFEENMDDDGKSLWEKLGDGLSDDNVGDMLLDLGYDVVLLDFPEGGTFIEENAMVCIAAINKLNELLQESGSNEQIVVVGPSMGGQITRYALAYMEQHPDANTNYGKHNCRLWISFDSPHQGANISMGVQAFVDYFRKYPLLFPLKNLWNNLLCSKAAQQMLVYHKKAGAGAIFNTYCQQITNVKYPNSARKISISNGSLNGTNNGSASQEALSFRAYFPYHIDIFARNMAHQGPCKVFELNRYIVFVKIPISWTFTNNDNKGSIDVAPGCKYYTFDIIMDKLLLLRILGFVFPDFNQHSHCFMPITSVLDINEPIPYATDVSNHDLVAEGKVPFDSYWGPLNKNMEHISFDYDLVDYLLNEIETYIQGPREIQLCTRPTYTLHLPQDVNASVTWLKSDNIRLVPTNNPNVVDVVPLAEGEAWISAVVSSLEHNDTLAHYPIQINNNTSFTPIVEGTTIQGQSLVISDDRYLTSDTFCVESGKTMTVTGTLHCSPGAHLIVRPGGKLVIDGGTLTSACDGEMWPGVEVLGDPNQRQLAQYQGIVELRNGATIENAHCGIHTGLQGDASYATTGGIILADSAYFINNRRSVAFLSYENTHPNGSVANNLSSFRRCVFSVNDNNHFMQDSCPFIDHVTMWEVRGVKFKGCRFENTATMPGDRRHAIYTENAGFEVDSHCDVQYYNGCECPEPYTVCCEFSGFTTAVEANTDGDSRAVLVNGARFVNNVTGVKINGTNFATVTRNDFNLQSRPFSPSNTGLYLNACGGYQVEGNRFHRAGLPVTSTSTGIRVENNGNTDNSIYRNVFDTLSYGIDVYGANGDANGGLQMLCGDFNGNVTDIRLATIKTTVSQQQGSLQVSAGNTFDGTSGYNIQSFANQNIVYYHTGKAVPGNPYYPGLRTTNVFPYLILSANGCASTLCNNGSQQLLSGFQSGMNAYTTALTGNNGDMDGGAGVETQNFAFLQSGANEIVADLRQSLSDTYHTAVRTLMSDSLLDLGTLEQWHAAAQPIADPYSLTETRFCEGYAETFAADVDDAEMANYAEFHAMKLALRNNVADDGGSVGANNYSPLQPGGHVNWYALTPAQIAQLQTIAERNTGRASVMAKGVLCFFHGICYEDDLLVDDNGDNNAGTRAKRVTTDITDDAALTVYPNPTDDLLFVELRGAEIARVALYDLQGRMVTGTGAHAGAPQQGTTATMNMRNVPAGVYLLRVTAADGKEYHQKVVKR